MAAAYIEFRNHMVSEESAEYHWREEYKFSIRNVFSSRPRASDYSIETINIAGEMIPGNRLWLLSVIKSTSDSFGHSTGEGEIVWAFHRHEAALAAAVRVDECKKRCSLEFFDDDGVEIMMSNPADCEYTDRITDITVSEFVINQ